MRHDAEHREQERKAIDEPERSLKPDNPIDELNKQFLCDNRVFLDQFREIV